MVVKACFARFTSVFLLSPACQRDDGDIFTPIQFSNGFTHLVTIEYGQTDIEQYYVGSVFIGGY